MTTTMATISRGNDNANRSLAWTTLDTRYASQESKKIYISFIDCPSWNSKRSEVGIAARRARGHTHTHAYARTHIHTPAVSFAAARNGMKTSKREAFSRSRLSKIDVYMYTYITSRREWASARKARRDRPGRWMGVAAAEAAVAVVSRRFSPTSSSPSRWTSICARTAASCDRRCCRC